MELIGITVIGAKPLLEGIRGHMEKSVREQRDKGKSPAMAILRIGKDPASEFYFRAKLKRGSELGIETRAITMDEDAAPQEVQEHLDQVVMDPMIHGIIVESPVPHHLDYKKIVNTIPWYKDIDGASYENLGRLMSGMPSLVAATPLAVMEFVSSLEVPQGSTFAVINRTITVGRPLSQLLLNSNYTPIVCHSKTRNIKELCKSSDVIVVAAGRPGFLGPDMVSRESIVIDVGINSVKGKMVGDARFDEIKDMVKAITPVPGGVGSLTSTLIFSNLIQAMVYQEDMKEQVQ